MSVDWGDVAGASHYRVRWRVAGPGNTLNAGVEVQSSSASITVDDYSEWVVRVQACNSAGCGSPTTSRFEVEPATPSLRPYAGTHAGADSCPYARTNTGPYAYARTNTGAGSAGEAHGVAG